MNFCKQESPSGEQKKLRGGATTTSLNPHAAEFVPFSLRASTGKQILDQSESANSDDESRQYWQQQLPDDITPDFEDEQHAILSLQSLSLHPSNAASSPFSDKVSPYSMSSLYADGGDAPLSISPSTIQRTSKPWDIDLLGSRRCLGLGLGEETSFRDSAKPVGLNNLDADAAHNNNNPNPVEFLASQFPGFAVESLAEVYFANCCDLNLTFDMLTQLELQVDGVTNQNMNLKTVSSPNLTSTDFPSLPIPDNKTNLQKYSGDELQQTINPYGSFDKDNLFLFKSSSSLNTKSATDFAAAVRKLASQDSGYWKYEKNGSADAAIGSSRSSHALTGLYSSGAGRSFSDKMQARGSARAAPVWLETGDAVANLYSDVREEARDRARLRNTYFEQARQAYLIGNKALAKELSVKGHLHNMQMKAAHCKAGESIYRERNPISPSLQAPGRCQEKMIDLHGLHVNEAIHVLKQELNVLRNAARLSEQRLHVYICVGTGHHTRGSRTPARLPIAVQRYLLHEEGLEYSEPQAGLLRVVLF